MTWRQACGTNQSIRRAGQITCGKRCEKIAVWEVAFGKQQRRDNLFLKPFDGAFLKAHVFPAFIAAAQVGQELASPRPPLRDPELATQIIARDFAH